MTTIIIVSTIAFALGWLLGTYNMLQYLKKYPTKLFDLLK